MSTATDSTSRSICDAIEEDIVTGKLPPGTKLDEVCLCQRFNVSRTPIREALRFLDERGLIELIRNRGAFVAAMSIPKLIEMFEVMAELEGMAGRLCARRMTPEQKTELLRSHRACQTALKKKNLDDYYYRNETFHEAIAAGSNNKFLIEQAKVLRRRLQPYRRMQLRVPQRVHDSFDEHEAIVEAILAGDAVQSERLLQQHVMVQGERFTDFVSLFSEGNAE